MNIVLVLLPVSLLAGEIMAFSAERKVPLFVVFGRPGSGKTTIADSSLQLLEENTEPTVKCVGLDLDVCISQWMKDNFSKGIYPTLKERQEFAETCCDYVDLRCAEEQTLTDDCLAAIVSFSFVNTDLRDVFRERFPHVQWLLVDTSEEEAALRISQREGHFYKGKPAATDETVERDRIDNDDPDNSQWNFDPVGFPHTVLDGSGTIETNAKRVADAVRGAFSKI